MATRQTYFAESNAEVSVTSSTYTDKTTLTFTPDANSDYFIIWSASARSSSSVSRAQVRLRDTTASADINNPVAANTAIGSGNYYSFGGVYKASFGASPSSQTYKIQYSNSNNANTTYIRDARIIAIKANAADQYASSDTESTTTSTSFQDKTTLTFTPSTTGDYVILASAEILNTTPSSGENVRLNVDGTIFDADKYYTNSTSDYYSWTVVKKVNLTNASHTLKIQYDSVTAATTSKIRSARIIALRADVWEAVNYAEQLTRQTTTSSSYASALDLTFTAVSSNYIAFASAALDFSSTLNNYSGRLNKSSNIYADASQVVVSSSQITSLFTLTRETLAAGSVTYSLEHARQTSGTMGSDDLAIVLLQVDPQPSGTVAVTEANDTSSASGVAGISGTVAVTAANQTSTASGLETFTGTSANTEANDTSSASGDEKFTGAVAATEINDSSSATGSTSDAGSGSVTEENDSSSATGTLGVIGTGAASQADGTGVATGEVSVATSDSETSDGGFRRKTKIEKAKAQSPKWQKKLDEEARLTEKLSQLYERIQNGYVPDEPKVLEIIEEIIIPTSEQIAMPVFDYRGLATNANKLRAILNEYLRLQEIMQDEEDILLLMS